MITIPMAVASTDVPQGIQDKVIETTKRLSDTVRNETGIESSLQEEDIEQYCKEVLAEIARK